MSESLSERIHPPTVRRRQLARQEGHVARSHDLATACLLLAGVGVLFWWGGDLVQFLGLLVRQQLGGQAWLSTDAQAAVGRCQTTLYGLGHAVLPILGLLVVAAALAHFGQIGWLFLPHKVTPDLARLHPGQGLQRIFSARSLIRLAFGLLKALVIVTIVAGSLWADRERLLGFGALAVGPLAAVLVRITLGTCVKVAGALLVLGVLDYAYQRWQLARDLRMTTQELREEQGHQARPQAAPRRIRAETPR